MRRRMLPPLAVVGMLLLGASPALADGPDDKSIEQAKKLLIDAGQAYGKAAALTDEMKLTFSMPGMPEQASTAKLRMSKDAAEATGVAEALDIHVVDGHLALAFAGADGVVKTRLGDDPLATAKSAMGMAASYLPPQIALRWMSEKHLDAIGEYFSFGLLESPRIAGYEKVEVDGVERHEVLLTGRNMLADDTPASCRVRIDPKTSFITSIGVVGGMEGMDETVTVAMKFKPEKHAKLDPPIAFDSGDAEVYENLDAMMAAGMGDMNPSVEVGSKAPTFELVDQAGNKHSSDVYAGKIMMLDWWGIW